VWLLIVLYVAIAVPVKALTGHRNSAPPIGTITAAMTSQSSDFWQRLNSAQRVELANDCQLQLAEQTLQVGGTDGGGNSKKQIMSLTGAQLAAAVDHKYADYSNTDLNISDACDAVITDRTGAQQARQAASSEAAQAAADAKQQAILASVRRGTFRATNAGVRAYMSAAQIGESTRSVTCAAGSCTIAYNDADPTSHPILDTIFQTTSTPETELIMPMTQLFAAVFSDQQVKQVTLTSWIDFQTVGGKSKRWPALTISCSRAANAQIDWTQVAPDGLRQLCTYSLLPDGAVQ